MLFDKEILKSFHIFDRELQEECNISLFSH